MPEGREVLRAVRRRRRQPRAAAAASWRRWSTNTTGSRSASPRSRRSRNRATRSTSEVKRRLEEAFVTPFDREDIHELVAVDDVVDGIQAVAETFVIYGVDRANRRGGRLAGILDGQAASCGRAREARGLKGLEGHLEAIHALENQADGISRAAVAGSSGRTSDPVEVIKWRDLYIDLENAIDAAEDAAEAIERMLHKAT